MTTYLLLCIISVLTGRGILRLISVKIESSASSFLAPIITLSFWTILLGLGVSSGFTVKDLRLFIWLLTILFAAVRRSAGEQR